MQINKVWQAAMVAVLGAGALFSQGNTGAILGSATDQSAALVPGVKIAVINVETGVTSSATTDSLGNFAVRFLPTGRYRLEAESAGFKKFVRQDIVLDVARELRIDCLMETGVVTESVTITGRPSLVETETGTLSSTVEQQQIVSLPLVGRDPQTLALLVPGVVDNGGNRVTNGGLVGRDPYYIDGSQNTNHVFGGSAVNPNPDVLQEFKVLTNSFSAEYGETTGAVMISSTKSGTNEFHGSAFEFFKNDKLNAGNFFTHQRPIVRYNQFGGTIGGPIVKNKTFIFFGFQATRDFGTSAYTNFSVPLPEFKNGDFSSVLGASGGNDVMGRPVLRFQIFDPLTTRTVKNAAGQDVVLRDPFVGNRIPVNRFSPAAVKIQALYPNPQINTPFSNYNSAGSRGTKTKNYDFKGDHNFTQNDKIMLRYAKKFSDAVGSQPFPNPLAGGDTYTTLLNPGHTATANYVHLFGARATNDLHLGWFEQFPKRLSAGSNLAGTKYFGINGLPNGDNTLLGTPNFTFTNYSRLGSTPDNLFFENQSSRSLVNQTSIVLNQHTLKFGGEARRILTDNLQPNPGNTQWTFQNLFTDQRGFGNSGFDYASFLLGLPRSLTYFIYPDYFRTRGSIYALFVQDDIRVSRKLTLNIGLRWDAPLWFHEKLNRTGVFDIGKGVYNQLGTNGFRDTPWQQNWKNFGPRFGFAYSPFGRDKTVIRGGYGLFSVGTSRSLRESFMELSPLFAEADGGKYTTTDSVNWRTTLDNVPFTPSGKTGAGYLAVNIYPDKNPMAYVQQWNTNVSHEFRGVLVEVGYAGSHGVHLPIGNNAIGGYNVNAIPLRLAAQARGQLAAPYITYPQYPNGVTVRTWIGNSIYHSLQAKVEKRFTGGFGVLAAYTWQKTIASEDGNFRDPVENRRMDRGLEGNSVPQRLSVAWNYELPFGKGRKWLTGGPLVYPFGGWEINGITTLQAGFPLTAGESFNSAQNGGTSRPNALRDPALAPGDRTLARWYDVSAFALPAQYTVGNSGRGLVYGPGTQSINLSIAKKFYGFGNERRNLEFRSEFFNLMNSPAYGNPNMTVDAATAGQITSAGNARQLQMALKFYF